LRWYYQKSVSRPSLGVVFAFLVTLAVKPLFYLATTAFLAVRLFLFICG